MTILMGPRGAGPTIEVDVHGLPRPPRLRHPLRPHPRRRRRSPAGPRLSPPRVSITTGKGVYGDVFPPVSSAVGQPSVDPHPLECFLPHWQNTDATLPPNATRDQRPFVPHTTLTRFVFTQSDQCHRASLIYESFTGDRFPPLVTPPAPGPQPTRIRFLPVTEMYELTMGTARAVGALLTFRNKINIFTTTSPIFFSYALFQFFDNDSSCCVQKYFSPQTQQKRAKHHVCF